jgi:uncharacterized protein
MIDWSKIEGFNWDEHNALKSLVKHSVGQFEAEEPFFNTPLLVVVDERHSQEEHRYHALGKTSADRLLHITFTLRAGNTLLRIISTRDMHRKERKIYEQA